MSEKTEIMKYLIGLGVLGVGLYSLSKGTKKLYAIASDL